MTVNAFPAGVTSCARARSSDAADGAAVDAIELAVGAGRLGFVRGCSAVFRGLTVIACIALATSRARATSGTAANHTAVYAPELAVVTRRLGRVRRGRASVGVRAIHASESRVTILTFASIWGKAAHGAAIDAVERPEAAVSAG